MFMSCECEHIGNTRRPSSIRIIDLSDPVIFILNIPIAPGAEFNEQKDETPLSD